MTNKSKAPLSGASPDLKLVDGLFQLSFHLQSQLARVAAGHALSVIQVRLLAILRDREPGMLELAGHLGLGKSSLSGLVDRAEKRGLVARVASAADGRGANVRMTAAGHRLSRVVEAEVNARVARLTGVLSKSERVLFAELLSRVVAGEGP